jgi:F-type H+-transporting ATPase subunit delta
MPGALANRYAQALADAVLTPGAGVDGRRIAEELRSFELMVKESVDLRSVLLSPAVSTSRKRAVVARFADTLSLSPLVRNFLWLMVDRRRTGILGEIRAAYETALDARLGFVRAAVTSAAPLSERQQAALQEALSRVAAKNVRCDFKVDPELLGGVIARIGSTVYDGSVRTQLEALRQRLVS